MLNNDDSSFKRQSISRKVFMQVREGDRNNNDIVNNV